MKSLYRTLFLLIVVCTLAHAATAQQLPSQRPKEALLSSLTQQKLRAMQAQWAGASAPTPGQEQRLPSVTVDVNKYAALLPPHQNTTSDSERSKKLPSNNKKIRPPARRPKITQ